MSDARERFRPKRPKREGDASKSVASVGDTFVRQGEEEVKMTVNLPRDLHWALKSVALHEHRTMREILEELLTGYLEGKPGGLPPRS